jgi:signal transduction histidine kinase
MSQAIFNLLDAVKFSRGNSSGSSAENNSSVIIKIKIRVSTSNDKISIEKFYRVAAVNTTLNRPGLALVKSIVEATMGILVENEQGWSTLIAIILPVG